MPATVLDLDRVSKIHWVGSYERPLFHEASLSLAAGDVVAVWGSPRSGKTTLLRIACGLETPDDGMVRVGGRDLATLSARALGSLRLTDIGLARTDGPRVAELPVLHYVALPLMRTHGRTGALRGARSVLAWVGAAHCAEARWEHLSDSERALVSLAHGLAREPKLLLVDDVTARLDALQQAEVGEVLRRAASERQVAVLMTCSALSAAVGAHESFTLSQRSLKRVTDPPVQGEVVRLRRQSGSADA